MRGRCQPLHRGGIQSALLSAMVLLGLLQFGLFSQPWIPREDGWWPARPDIPIPNALEFIVPSFGFPQIPVPADAMEPEPIGDGGNWNRNRSEDWLLATVLSTAWMGGASMVVASIPSMQSTAMVAAAVSCVGLLATVIAKAIVAIGRKAFS